MIFSKLKVGFLIAFLLSFTCSYAETKVDSLLLFANNYIKTPYRSGGNTPAGFDCSGFTSFVFSNFGYKLNRTSSSQVENGEEVKRKDLLPGDLVFFAGRRVSNKRIGHTGIVTEVNNDGSFYFIHAAVQTGVIVSRSDEKYYAQRYITACRVISSEPLVDPEKEQKQETIETEAVAIEISPTNSFFHTVEKGQTLYSISRQYNCNVSELKEWNNLHSNAISIGQKLEIRKLSSIN